MKQQQQKNQLPIYLMFKLGKVEVPSWFKLKTDSSSLFFKKS